MRQDSTRGVPCLVWVVGAIILLALIVGIVVLRWLSNFRGGLAGMP